jgi:hypothetical protein
MMPNNNNNNNNNSNNALSKFMNFKKERSRTKITGESSCLKQRNGRNVAIALFISKEVKAK